MGKIEVLSEFVANQIAAGEVVERPVSVVKELVDNALDAGADEIEIRLENGGVNWIEVVDNGSGMDKLDLEKSVVRHATSKLKSIEDLQKLVSMGFRGEALASIASVSELEIKSKQESDLSGNQIKIKGGVLESLSVVGMPKGTVVRVNNLFGMVPARKKFLKTPNTEFRQIVDLVNHLSLGWSNVGFKLINNDREIFNYNKKFNLIDRVIDVFGREMENLLLEGGFDNNYWQIKCWIGKPQTGKEKGNKQFLIVNKRPVSDKMVISAVRSTMGSLLPPRYQVPWVIIVDMPSDLVDVNVHPRKEEVRFVNSQSVYKSIVQMVNSVIEKEDLSFVRETSNPIGLDVNNFEIQTSINSRYDRRHSLGMNDIKYDFRNKNNYESGNFRSKSIGEPEENISDANLKTFVNQILPWEEMSEKKGEIMQINNLYLVYQDDGLVIADQHAVHERIRYEQLLDNYEHNQKGGQKLLVPIEYELGVRELAVWEENLSVLEMLGFVVKLVSNKMLIYEVPIQIASENIRRVIDEVTGDLIDGGEVRVIPDNRLKVITYLSCRTAIKGGTKLDQMQMQTLISDLQKCQRPYTCPHGRPVLIKMGWKELEKMFLRTGL